MEIWPFLYHLAETCTIALEKCYWAGLVVNQTQIKTMRCKLSKTLPRLSFKAFCNVLHIWEVRTINSYYRLYDYPIVNHATIDMTRIPRSSNCSLNWKQASYKAIAILSHIWRLLESLEYILRAQCMHEVACLSLRVDMYTAGLSRL